MAKKSVSKDTIISALKPSDLKHPGLLWTSAFGIGFLPKAPGTWGSVAALFVWWLLIGEAYSMLGQPERGSEIAREMLALNPLSRDALEAPNLHSRAARLLTLTGEIDEGLGVLSEVLDQPGGPTRWELRLHPFWYFVRDDPRFMALAGLDDGA